MIAIIPARGGSKGLPRKNLKEVNGVPLVQRSIIHARPFCETIIVSTDDIEIANLATKQAAKVHWRKESLAQDHTSINDVVRDVVETANIKDDLLILLPTYPFRDHDFIRDFIKGYKDDPQAESALCCVEAIDPPDLCFYAGNIPVYGAFRYRRQDRLPTYRIYHYVICCHSLALDRLDDGFWNRSTIYKLLEHRPIDIDTEDDLRRANARATEPKSL